MHFTTSFLTVLQCSGAATAAAIGSVDQKPLQDDVRKGILEIRHELLKAEIIPTVIDDFFPSLALSVSWSHKKKHHKGDKPHNKEDGYYQDTKLHQNHHEKHNHKEAKLGNTLKPKHLQNEPKIKLDDITLDGDGCVTTNMTYVVTLTDPDAPSRKDPKWSEMCHWIAQNVSLSSHPSSECAPERKEREAEQTFSSLPIAPFSLDSAALDSTEDEEIEVEGVDSIIDYKPPGPPPKTGKHRYVFIVLAPKNRTTLPLNLTKPSERKHWGTGKEGGGVREWAEVNGLEPVGANFIYSKNKKQ